MNTNRLLTVTEAADIARIGRSVAYRLTRSGEWPVIRIGRCVRIDPADLSEWIDSKKTRRVE